MTLPVTTLVTVVCAFLLLITAIDTVRQRLRAKLAFGDGGDAKLISASRSHGNLAEHAPIVIIMIGLLELGQANHQLLQGIAVLFLIGRVAHIIGLYTPSVPGKAPIPRQIGVIATWATLAVLIVLLGLRLV
jgi:uncharacterized membrane protein YecN with MAPEG domain